MTTKKPPAQQYMLAPKQPSQRERAYQRMSALPGGAGAFFKATNPYAPQQPSQRERAYQKMSALPGGAGAFFKATNPYAPPSQSQRAKGIERLINLPGSAGRFFGAIHGGRVPVPQAAPAASTKPKGPLKFGGMGMAQGGEMRKPMMGSPGMGRGTGRMAGPMGSPGMNPKLGRAGQMKPAAATKGRKLGFADGGYAKKGSKKRGK